MNKRAALVEWSILDNEEEWQESLLPPQGAQAAVARWSGQRSEVYLGIMTFLLFLVVMGGWLWTRQQRAATVQKGSLAAVEAGAPHIANPRYAFNYAEGTIGESRMDEEPQQRLDTPHFSITFSAVHAEVVQEVAPKLEELYARICNDFGIAEGDCFYYTKIDVLPNRVLPNGRPVLSHFNSAEGRITIVAPTLLFAPEDGNAAHHLFTALIYPVASLHLLDIVKSQQRPPAQEAIAPEESELLLSQQSREYVNWPTLMLALRVWVFYQEGGRTDVANVHLARWMNVSEEFPPVAVTDGTLAGEFTSVTGLAKLLDYGLARYGREGLPALLARYGQPTTREEMIRLLFDLSYEEFEAGWQAQP